MSVNIINIVASGAPGSYDDKVVLYEVPAGKIAKVLPEYVSLYQYHYIGLGVARYQGMNGTNIATKFFENFSKNLAVTDGANSTQLYIMELSIYVDALYSEHFLAEGEQVYFGATSNYGQNDYAKLVVIEEDV